MARRMILDLKAGDRVRWRDLVASVEHVEYASSLALLSYRKPGQAIRYALVHLAELELI